MSIENWEYPQDAAAARGSTKLIQRHERWIGKQARYRCARNRPMAQKPEMSPEGRARREHAAWLADYGRWRAEHREALAMLAKVQAAILERESALERQAAEIQSHQLELADYNLIGGEPGTPDPEKELAAHAELAEQHERAREAYERTKREHIDFIAEVNKLFDIRQLVM
jgi:hypothetical protein